MVAIASRARVLSTLAAAGTALIATQALTPTEAHAPQVLCASSPREHADDGMRLAARWIPGPARPGCRRQTGPSEARTDHVVVEIAAPGDAAPVRPPLSVVVAIDRSKSMSGEMLADAKAAA